ncbi:MAG: hypothetical protein ACPL5I_05235 [Thermodesulfobacteriota bacterium]
MQIFKEYPSLRNFLNPLPGGCFLQISLISDNQEILEKSNFPFLEATHSDPWHRLIKGKFITEAYSEIQEVFLLIPRDNYLLKKDELWPITNSSIDQNWQRALLKHWQEKSSIFLSNPIDEKKELLSPWEPLIFCKKQKIFFPNLCPHCGKVLHLCREDDLLSEYNLPSYSQTLERYLYCPSCSKQGKMEFFTYASNHAHPHVKDRLALMDGLGNLLSLELKEDIFPCKICQYQGECFGVKNLVRERITPFSFYPFYMLIFKARSLNAQDFISLLGGAEEKELHAELQLKQEWGRRESLKSFFQNKDQHAHHLFGNNKDNFFIEVLYLKLTFLHGVIQKLWGENSPLPYPEIGLSLDRIWVDLPAPGLLPTFWDFQVEIIDLPPAFPLSPFSNLPSTETFYFLGQLWFYTLLANKRQKISQVYSALGKAREIILKAESFSFVEISPAFWPENIFWNPDGPKVPASFVPLWEESLKLGWSLLSLSLPEKSTLSSENFLNKLGKLREEIKNHLFQLKGPEPKATSSREDATISQILKKLLAEWTKAAQLPAEEAMETLILTPGLFKKEVTPPTVADETPETVIVSQEDYQKTKPSAAPELEEAIQTVILRPESKRPEKPAIPAAQSADEEVAQTVILGAQSPPPDDLGAETVIITPPSKTASERKKTYAEKLGQEEIPEIAPARREEQDEIKEDLLSETVIIQPKKTSEKGRYGGKK